MIAFVWCYKVGIHLHQLKPIQIKNTEEWLKVFSNTDCHSLLTYCSTLKIKTIQTYFNFCHVLSKILDQVLKSKIKKTTKLTKHILEYQNHDRLKVRLDSLLSSYIHMLVNRAFRSKQCFYELVCYDFLSRFYRNQIGRRG